MPNSWIIISHLGGICESWIIHLGFGFSHGQRPLRFQLWWWITSRFLLRMSFQAATCIVICKAYIQSVIFVFLVRVSSWQLILWSPDMLHWCETANTYPYFFCVSECRTSHLHCNTQDGSTSRSSDNNRPQEHPVEAFLSKIRGKVEAKESCTRQPDPTEQRQTTKRPSLWWWW